GDPPGAGGAAACTVPARRFPGVLPGCADAGLVVSRLGQPCRTRGRRGETPVETGAPRAPTATGPDRWFRRQRRVIGAGALLGEGLVHGYVRWARPTNPSGAHHDGIMGLRV